MGSAALLPDAPIPIQDPIARPARYKGDPQEGLVSPTWVDWFTRQGQVVEQSMVRIASAQLTEQDASIGATDFSGGTLGEGLYEVKWYARITTPGTVSSSLEVSIDWQDGGVTQSAAGAALTGNLTTTYESQSFFIHLDGASPVRYSTTYASAGATPMQYALYLVLQRVFA